MQRLLFTALGLALLPAMAQARNCAEVLRLGVPFQEAAASGPSSPPTFLWRATAQNFTSTRQTMQIWLTGINNVANPVNAAFRHHLSPNGQMTVTLGRISGAQPTVEQMQAAIRTSCEG
jgi:hypothetical protein